MRLLPRVSAFAVALVFVAAGVSITVSNEDGSIKPGKLDQKSVELIVDWLRRDYTKTKDHN